MELFVEVVVAPFGGDCTEASESSFLHSLGKSIEASVCKGREHDYLGADL
jgi:hypothetical protein